MRDGARKDKALRQPRTCVTIPALALGIASNTARMTGGNTAMWLLGPLTMITANAIAEKFPSTLVLPVLRQIAPRRLESLLH